MWNDVFTGGFCLHFAHAHTHSSRGQFHASLLILVGESPAQRSVAVQAYSILCGKDAISLRVDKYGGIWYTIMCLFCKCFIKKEMHSTCLLGPDGHTQCCWLSNTECKYLCLCLVCVSDGEYKQLGMKWKLFRATPNIDRWHLCLITKDVLLCVQYSLQHKKTYSRQL